MSLFIKELRELRWVMVVGILLLALIAVAVLLLEGLQDMLLDFLQGEIRAEMEFIMSDFTLYVWSQWHPKNLLQIGTIVAILAGAPAIAGELGRGSLEFLASRPLRRGTIVVTKAAAGALAVSIVCWLSTLALLAAAQVLGPAAVNWGKLLAATALTNAGLLLVYSLALACSVHFRDAVKAGATAAGALFVYSALGLFKPTRFLSFFYHMRGIDWFVHGASYPWLPLVVLIVAAIAFVGLSIKLFENREY